MRMRKAMIQIPQKRFEELIKLEERVNVAVETAMNEEYASVTDILFILGTELAYDIANERKEKYKKWMKEKMES
jgi:hypothetical protein